MLLRCIFKGSGSNPSETAVLEEQKYKVLFILMNVV